MHTNVHCSTVCNSKDLEPTQMLISDRLDRENVAHIHHGILCSNQKRWVRVICRDMDEPVEHHSQQTDTRTENEVPPFISKVGVEQWEHMDTGRGALHTGVCWGNRGGTAGGGELGRDSMGKNARYRWRGGRQQITLPHVYLCNYLACSSHVPQNLKCNLKKKDSYLKQLYWLCIWQIQSDSLIIQFTIINSRELNTLARQELFKKLLVKNMRILRIWVRENFHII